jgi:hypothetical protein
MFRYDVLLNKVHCFEKFAAALTPELAGTLVGYLRLAQSMYFTKQRTRSARVEPTENARTQNGRNPF